MYNTDADPLGDRPLGEFAHTRFMPLWRVAGYETRTPARIGSYGTPMFHHAQWVVPEGRRMEASDVSEVAGVETDYLQAVNFPKLRHRYGIRGTKVRRFADISKRRHKLLMAPNTRAGNLATPMMMQRSLFQRDPVRYAQYQFPARFQPSMAHLANLERRYSKQVRRQQILTNRLGQPNLRPQQRMQLENRLDRTKLKEDMFARRKAQVIGRIQRNPRLVYALKADPVLRAEIERNPVFEDIKAAIDDQFYTGSYPNN